MPSWSPKLAINVPAIDRQHQELFNRLDSFLDAIKQARQADEIGRTLDFLAQYVTVHFGAEERLMESRRYAGLAAHRVEHDVFRKEFAAIQQIFKEKGPVLSLSMRCNNLFNGWLVNHIAKVDTKLGESLGEQRAQIQL